MFRSLKHKQIVRVLKQEGEWIYCKARNWKHAHWINENQFTESICLS